MSKNGDARFYGKMLLGAIACPILMIVCSSTPGGVSINMCTGIFALLTVVFWFVLYRRAKEVISSLRGSVPARTQLPTIQPTPAATVEPADDSRSIFL